LERINRWLTWALISLGVCLAAAIVMAVIALISSRRSDLVVESIETRKLVLRDDIGGGVPKERARLLLKKDAVSLVLSDQIGKERAGLILDKDGPDLTFWDENGTARASLGMTKDGPHLAFWDEKGNILRR
jgi:hypothetical protein